MPKKPMVLIVLDGWGVRPPAPDNAISCCNPFFYNQLCSEYPYTELVCSGLDVGLPKGLMGNSEVGHLNIGSGRIVFQEITRISNAIEDGSFFTNPELVAAVQNVQQNNSAMHLMGLLSDGGVHSHMNHIEALLELCRRHNLQRVYIHAYLDGRDVAPRSALQYIQQLQATMDRLQVGEFATISGRFYGMDRDKRWERVQASYDAMVLGEGNNAPNALAAVESSYENRITDEFVEPVVIVDEQGRPRGTIQDGDSMIFFNFRADRARQITRALVDENFAGFKRSKWPRIHYVCMTQYDADLNVPVAFPPQNLNNTLGEVLAQNGLKQLRIAETEKYAHVTFFFNGGVEEPNPGEDRILIPSPKVATYNLQPAMSAVEVTDRVIEEIGRDYYDVVIMNYANPDMVGHTGVLEAAVEACSVVDHCLQRVVKAVLERQGCALVTADHGNCEMMVCPNTGVPLTSHTTDLVPFILVSDQHRSCQLRKEGSLRDIAPTMLDLLGISIPEEMTGRSLIV
ncbi:MAG TPA: 2,3-bisphosphoglycerate-independent phosphoglycerate mutase [Syntrophomonadaceae bacterium]|nr:2,3-bisphosphoglycerate-independent phosphoglycerate mutase [Syntrophomonadaceae bacterium]